MEFLLAELGPGQMFGEMALLTKKARTASVVALEPTTLREAGARRLRARAARASRRRARPRRPRSPSASSGPISTRASISSACRACRSTHACSTLVPTALVTQHQAVPIAFCNNRLTLAMTNPNNVMAFDDVRRILKGVMIEPVIVTEDDFKRFMSTTYAQLTAKPRDAPRPRRRRRVQRRVSAPDDEGTRRRRSSICCSRISSASCSWPRTPEPPTSKRSRT